MFFLSPLGGFRTLRSATRGLWVSPAGSVGAAAPGSGVHRTPAPPGPLPPFEKGGPKESLNKSRLPAQHLSCLPFFRHLVQKALDNRQVRQVACGLFAQSDEKIADAIQALDLISASLNFAFITSWLFR